ncbi:MAG: DEAD/DEAH box helicase family protein [Vulcanibacillus sp.]
MNIIEKDDPLYNAYSYYRSYYEENYEIQSIMRIKKQPVPVETGFTKSKYDWRDDERIKLVKLPKINVSDGIGEDYLTWTRGSAYMISAQTGMGKNFFVSEYLLKYAIEKGLKIIIFLNRIALARQVKKDIAQKQGISFPSDYTTRELDEREVFGCVTIKTYQRIIYDLKNSRILDMHNGKILDRDFDICVFDECHQYCNDSGMTSHSYISLKELRKYYHNSIRLYMTSTPNEVAPWIIEVERIMTVLERTIRISNPLLSWSSPNTIKCYDFKRDYSFVKTRYFRSIEQIIEKILEDKTDFKWIIYVRSKAEGREITEKLGDKVAVFIDSSSKKATGTNNDTFEEIINNEKFSTKVLVTTTVLDNGANIKDSKLKHIVIMTIDETVLIQTLGRKRRSSDKEEVYLYIQNLTENRISNFINSIQDKLDAYDLSDKRDLIFKRDYLTDNPDGYEKICKLYYFKNRSKIEWNPIAISKLQNDKSRLEEIKNKIKNGDDDAFIKEQLSWLGLEGTFDKKNYIDNKQSEDNLNDFVNFLEQFVDKPIGENEQEKFKYDFTDKCIKAYGKRKNEKGQDKDRNDRVYSIDIVAERLITNNLPYTIESANGVWTIKRKIDLEDLK